MFPETLAFRSTERAANNPAVSELAHKPVASQCALARPIRSSQARIASRMSSRRLDALPETSGAIGRTHGELFGCLRGYSQLVGNILEHAKERHAGQAAFLGLADQPT